MNKGINVLFVTHYTSTSGGANRSLLNLIDGLHGTQINPILLTPAKGQITSEIERRNIECIVEPFPWIQNPTPNVINAQRDRLRWQLCRLSYLRHKCAEKYINLVYSNSSVISVGLFLAHFMNLPHIWHLREFGSYDYNLTIDFSESIFGLLLAGSECNIAVSQALKNHFGKMNLLADIDVIYNGVAFESDLMRFKAIRQSSPAIENQTFAMIGVMHPPKGQHHAISAIAIVKKKFPKVKLLLAGDGPTRPQLEKLANQLDVTENIEFLGTVQNPFEVFLRARAALVCSRSEAMGRVTAEAMATMCPVIGRKSGGTVELIHHGKTGFHYQEDAEELASRMIEVLGQPEHAQRMAEDAWHFARSKFLVEKYSQNVLKKIDETFKIYRSAAENRLSGTAALIRILYRSGFPTFAVNQMQVLWEANRDYFKGLSIDNAEDLISIGS